MVELFTCQIDAVWMVCWQRFDADGAMIAEGRVQRTAARVQAATRLDFAAIQTALLVRKVPFDVVRGVVRVDASPSLIEAAIERMLIPMAEGHEIPTRD